ncbi:MAG: FAD:protein FMN transferase [Gammaproteobacteria bacterium]|nr:FAD:protein FMN transferase [Gammaproteobacteria bacterium]
MSITGALSRRRAIQIVASAASLALVTGLRGALAAARAFGEATGGAFDPTVQPLWTLYATHFAASAARPEGPDGSAIDKAIALVDYRNLSLTTSRVAFERRGMGITLNGIAQGYITDRVADLLRNEGLDDVLVDLGEIRGLGHHADGRPWTVGLKDPLEPARIVDTLTLENRALASSAGSATRFDARGRHHHLFDPRSGASSNRYLGITVIAPTATTADALSTGFASMDVDEVKKALRYFPSVTARITTSAGEVVTL